MREQMFKAEMLNQQLEQLEQQLQQLQHQHKDMRKLIDDLDQLKTVKSGDEILVPVAPGVFTHASFSGKQDLFVNVGQGTIVTKTPEDVQEQIQEQLDAMESYEQELRTQFDDTLRELDTVKESFKE